MPLLFSTSAMFLKTIFCPWKHEKTGLKSCQTGPNPAQISIPVPQKSPTAQLLYNDFGKLVDYLSFQTPSIFTISDTKSARKLAANCGYTLEYVPVNFTTSKNIEQHSSEFNNWRSDIIPFMDELFKWCFFNFVYLQIVHKLLFQTSSNLTIFDTKRARKLATKGGLTSKYLLTSQPAKPAASSIINRVTAFFYGRKFVIPKGSNFYNLWYQKGKRISCQRSYFGIPVTFTNNKNIELHSSEFTPFMNKNLSFWTLSLIFTTCNTKRVRKLAA